jgi:hypothetical protein
MGIRDALGRSQLCRLQALPFPALAGVNRMNRKAFRQRQNNFSVLTDKENLR